MAELVAKQNTNTFQDARAKWVPPSSADFDIFETTVDEANIEGLHYEAGSRNPIKRSRMSTGDVVRTYHPECSVMVNDRFEALAPIKAKEVGNDLYSAFILPEDRLVYEEVGVVSACIELLGHLTMVYSFYLFFPDTFHSLLNVFVV